MASCIRCGTWAAKYGRCLPVALNRSLRRNGRFRPSQMDRLSLAVGGLGGEGGVINDNR